MLAVHDEVIRLRQAGAVQLSNKLKMLDTNWGKRKVEECLPRCVQNHDEWGRMLKRALTLGVPRRDYC